LFILGDKHSPSPRPSLFCHQMIRLSQQNIRGQVPALSPQRGQVTNMLLLKLWPDLHLVTRHVFHRHPETVAWFDDPESFRRQLFGTSAIRGYDLQAIVLLMGHGSSATTLEHYIHVLDWYSNPDRRDAR
jgi:hypothetical protein